MSDEAAPDAAPSVRYRTPPLVRVLLVLLIVHAVLVYTAPQYLGLSRIDASRFAGLHGGPPAQQPQRVMERDGRQWLWGGKSPGQHFDVTGWTLNADQLHYGLGREAFPALIEPQFVPVPAARQFMTPPMRVLLVQVGGQTKVYPVDLLIRHEVVNDTVGGTPIFAAYCILADLGAVYDRRIAGHTLTFGVSGYTYFDPAVWDGFDAFLLWDRDTESLWWPPIGVAVAGPMQGQGLPLLDEQYWSQTTWSEIEAHHPDALVLRPGQDLVRPADWPRLDLADAPATQPADAPPIAPRWGRNDSL